MSPELLAAGKMVLVIGAGWCFLSALTVWFYCIVRATYISFYLHKCWKWRTA